MKLPQSQPTQESTPVEAPTAKAHVSNNAAAQKLGAVKPAVSKGMPKSIAPAGSPSGAKGKPSSDKPRSGQSKHLQFLTVGLLVVILGLLLGVFVKLLTIKDDPVSSESTTSVTQNPDRALSSDPKLAISNYPATPEKINRDRFNQIKKGMTLKQVEEVIGSPGKLIADSSSTGGTGQVYSWKNPQGSNAIVEFKNGKVAAKAQAGL